MTALMTPHFSALGFTLIHFCWQAALIAGLYKLVDVSLPRLRAPERYLLGLVALVVMLVTAIGTFVYEDIRLASEPSFVALGPVVAEGAVPHVRNVTLETMLPWLDAAWLVGVAALSVRMAGGLLFIHRLSAAAEAVPEAVARRFDVLMQRAGLKNVRIRLHRHIDGPFVIGALRSVVYLPVSALTSLSPDQLDAVLAHELEHVRRADYLWNLVQSLIETLFFFHPAVWWLGGRLREQRELCCDDAAIALCRDPVTYATALLNLEEQRRGPRLAMALNGQGSGRTLVSRVARVLGEHKGSPKRRPPAAYALPVILLVVTAFAAPGARVAAQDKPQTVKLAASDETAADLMDDATASSVSSRANNADTRFCPKTRAAVDAAMSKARDDVKMATAAIAMAGDEKTRTWKREDGEWKKEQDTWKQEKDQWKQEAKAWQDQAGDDASRDVQLSFAWTPERAKQVADGIKAAVYLTDDDRKDIELETKAARKEALAEARDALRDQQDELDQARREMRHLRAPAAPEAPYVVDVPDAPAAPEAPVDIAIPAPRAAPAPPAAPGRPAPAPRPAVAPAPTPRVSASYNYRIAATTYTQVRVAQLKTVKVKLAPLVTIVHIAPSSTAND